VVLREDLLRHQVLPRSRGLIRFLLFDRGAAEPFRRLPNDAESRLGGNRPLPRTEGQILDAAAADR
jgi:hypothetical protein